MTVPRTIHFIWWGDPRGRYEDQAFLGPNRIADHLYQDKLWEVKYWFDQAHEDFFDNELNPKILRQPIDNFDVPGKREGFSNRSHNSLRQSVIDTLRGLSGYQAYSAMKDLFELYILYLQGGFYFDTTTFVPSPEPFFRALAAESDRTLPQFVLNDPRVLHKYFKGIGNLEQFIDTSFLPPGDTDYVVAIDYWAAAAGKQDEIMKESAKRYAQRWKYISNPRRNIRISRNGGLKRLVIGHLIDWAVKDTFIKHYRDDIDRMNERCFQAYVLRAYHRIYYSTLEMDESEEVRTWHEDRKNAEQDINFDREYELDRGPYRKLFADQHIGSGNDYRTFLRRIDRELAVARDAQFNAVSWVDKYQFFKHSGQTWV